MKREGDGKYRNGDREVMRPTVGTCRSELKHKIPNLYGWFSTPINDIKIK